MKRREILKEFEIDSDVLEPYEILWAKYEEYGYEGRALIILEDVTGQLWEVNATHCSCYGLAGQWEPERTSLEALSKAGGIRLEAYEAIK